MNPPATKPPAPLHGRNRRGLTLLEVLIATALLAVLSVACVPAIARAMVVLHEGERVPKGSLQMAELQVVADAVLEDPKRSGGFGLGATPLHGLATAEIAWPSDMSSGEHAAITVRAIRSREPNADHIWLLFECEGVTVSRWVELPASKDDKEDRQR